MKKAFSHLPLRVCFFGTYRRNYTRHQVLLERLKSAGVQVTECHERLWLGELDRIDAASGKWLSPKFIYRVMRVYLKLIVKYFRVGPYDILIVGYPGQFDVFIARILSWIRGKPLVWDILMSIFLIAKERRLERKSALTVNALRWLEWLVCRLPDRLFLDTQAYVDWFTTFYNIPASRFHLVPLGADGEFFQGAPEFATQNDRFRILYYGTFIPNHGVQYILEAAKVLNTDGDLEFILVGDGPQKKEMEALAQAYELNNTTFISWMEKTQLIAEIKKADLCLGTFGTTPQALITVQNKIFECLAIGKPVITGDSPAVREILNHGEHLYLCPRADSIGLAEGIHYLWNNPDERQKMARTGNLIIRRDFNPRVLGLQLEAYLQQIIKD